jgi:hypothetical protein
MTRSLENPIQPAAVDTRDLTLLLVLIAIAVIVFVLGGITYAATAD